MFAKKATNRDTDNLFVSFLEGDAVAFSHFYKLFFNDMYSYGLGMGLDRETIKDQIQDIFYRVYKDRRHYSSPSHLKFYLLKSLRNKTLDLRRKQGMTLADPDLEPGFSITTTIVDDLIDMETRAILERKVDQLLSLLTSRQREAVFLRYMEELSYEEIANMLQMTPHGVRKLVSRGLLRMKDAAPEQTLPLIIALFAAGKIIF